MSKTRKLLLFVFIFSFLRLISVDICKANIEYSSYFHSFSVDKKIIIRNMSFFAINDSYVFEFPLKDFNNSQVGYCDYKFFERKVNVVAFEFECRINNISTLKEFCPIKISFGEWPEKIINPTQISEIPFRSLLENETIISGDDRSVYIPVVDQALKFQLVNNGNQTFLYVCIANLNNSIQHHLIEFVLLNQSVNSTNFTQYEPILIYKLPPSVEIGAEEEFLRHLTLEIMKFDPEIDYEKLDVAMKFCPYTKSDSVLIASYNTLFKKEKKFLYKNLDDGCYYLPSAFSSVTLKLEHIKKRFYPFDFYETSIKLDNGNIATVVGKNEILLGKDYKVKIIPNGSELLIKISRTFQNCLRPIILVFLLIIIIIRYVSTRRKKKSSYVSLLVQLLVQLLSFILIPISSILF